MKVTVNFYRNQNSSDTTKDSRTYTWGVSNQKFVDFGWTKTGYSALGYNEIRSATSKQYELTNGISNDWIISKFNANSSHSVNLYEIWKAKQYNFTITGDSGIESVTGSGTYDYGTVVKSTIKVKTGYHIVNTSGTTADGSGTNTWTNLSGKEGTQTENWTINGNRTIKVNSAPNTYIVTYDGNGATSGSMSASTATYNADFMTRKNAFVKTGYTFNGWKQKDDGGANWSLTSPGVYESGKSWKWTYTKNITLVAQWTPNKYRIDVTGDSGVESISGNGSYNYGTSVTLTYKIKNGYHITSVTGDKADGTQGTWTDLAGKDGTQYDTWTIVNFNRKGVVHTAPNTYSDNIGLLAGGFKNGEGNHSSKNWYYYSNKYFNKNYGDTINITTSDCPELPKGFYLNSSQGFGSGSFANSWTGYTFPKSFTQPAKDVYFEFYALPNTYSITYNMNGGTNNSSNPSSYNILYGVTFSNPTRKGYTFTGWTDENGNKVTGINPGANATFSSASDMKTKLNSRTIGNKTIIANWRANSYTVTIHPNSGSINVGDKNITKTSDGCAKFTVTYGSSSFYALGVSGSKTGYTTTGIFDKTSGGIKVWNNGGYCLKDGKYWNSSNQWCYAGNVDLYFQWTPNHYKLTLNPNNGKFNSDNSTAAKTLSPDLIYDSGNWNNISYHSVSKTGYTLQGWYTAPSGGTKVYNANGSCTNEGTYFVNNVYHYTNNLIVYAHWTPNTYTVTYDSNKPKNAPTNVTGSTASNKATYDSNFLTTKNGFSLTGYTFVGWNEKPDGSGTAWTLTTNGVYEYENGKHPWKWNYTKDITLYAQWIPNTYTVTYNKNKPSNATHEVMGTTANSSHVYDTAKNLTKNGYSIVGWRFNGWNDKPDGTGKSYKDQASVKNLTTTNNGNVILYAQWVANTYIVTYNKNKPSDATHEVMGTTTNSSHVYDTAKNLTKNGYSLVGWKFNGWNDKPDGTGKPYKDQESVKNLTTSHGGTVILYAQWIKNNYTVTYNKNKPAIASYDVQGTTASNIATYDSNFVTTKNGYSLVGWRFNGWNEKPDGTGTAWTLTTNGVYEYENGKHPWKWTYDKNVTLYAQWIPNTYTITYDSNKPTKASGSITGSTANSSHTYDVTKSLTMNGYKLTGWTFTGWNDKKDGSGNSYSDGQIVKNLTDTHNGTVTLYAQWRQNTYTIIYDKNKPGKASGTVTGNTVNSVHTYEEWKTLTPNNYWLDGWTFTGWNDKPNGTGKSYKDKQSVLNLMTSDKGSITLYAQWTQNKLTLNFHNDKAEYYKTGNDSSTNIDIRGKDLFMTNNYYYDNNYDSQWGLPNVERFTKTGYHSGENWYVDKLGSSLKISDSLGLPYVQDLAKAANKLDAFKKGNITIDIYPQLNPNHYYIKFDKNKPTKASSEVTGSMSNVEHIYDTAKTLPANGYKLTGWTFTGWNTKADGSGKSYSDKSSVVNLTTENQGTTILYAQWRQNTYTINYNGNKPAKASHDVTGSTASSSHIYEEWKTLTPNGFSLTGWTFTGWNDKPDGTGKSYKDKQSIRNLVTTDKGSITLYAQWRQNTYTIIYDKNKPGKASHDVQGTMPNSSHNYDDYKKLTKNNYTLTGWTFTGWNTKPDGSGTKYSDEQSIRNFTPKDKGTFTLYAQWKQNRYTITFHKNHRDVTGTMNVQWFTYDEQQKLSKNQFVLKGYRFDHWNTKSNNSGISYNDQAIILNLTPVDSGNIDFYAQWKLNINISMTVEDEIYHVNDIVTPSDIRESIKPKIVDKATGEDITYTFNPDVTRDPLTNIVTKEIINDEGTKQDVTKNLITNKEDHYKVTYEFTITDTGITEKSTQTQKLTVIKDIEDIEQNKPKDPDPTNPTPSITPDPGTTNPMVPDGIDPSDGSQYNVTNDIRYISKKYLPSLNKNSKWRTNSDLFNELKTSVSKEATDDNAIYIIEFNKDECDEMKQWLVDGKVWNEDLNKQFLNEFGSKIIKKQP